MNLFYFIVLDLIRFPIIDKMVKRTKLQKKAALKKEAKRRKFSEQKIVNDDNAFSFDDTEINEVDPFAEFTGSNMPEIPKDDKSKKTGWKTVELSSSALQSGDFEGLLGFEVIDSDTFFGKNDVKKIDHITNKEIGEEENGGIETQKPNENENKPPAPKKEKTEAQKLKKKLRNEKNKAKKLKQVQKMKAKMEKLLETQKGKVIEGNAKIADKSENSNNNQQQQSIANWTSLHVPEAIIPGLTKFSSPTEIQLKAIPAAIRDKNDVIGIAETGSGKTLAFCIPLIARLLELKEKKLLPQVNNHEINETKNDTESKFELKKTGNQYLPSLIMLPTRELAKQVYDQLKNLCYLAKLSCSLIVGGLSLEKHYRMLNNRPDIIVATPGRLHQCFEAAHPYLVHLNKIAVLCLDEADRLVSTGDYKELRKIIEEIEKEEIIEKETEKPEYQRQTLFFSATISNDNRDSKKVDELQNLMTLNKNLKTIDLSTDNITPSTLLEYKYDSLPKDKDALCYYFIRQLENQSLENKSDKNEGCKMIIFANTVDQVLRLSGVLRCLVNNDEKPTQNGNQVNNKRNDQKTEIELEKEARQKALTENKWKLYSLHARMQQKQRLKNIENFTNNKNTILIATDVACRGLDIPKVNLVVHFSTPHNSDLYIHRSGRTARAGKQGTSILLVTPEEYAKEFKKLCTELGNKNYDFPDYDVNLRVFREIIRPIVEVAKDLDQILNRQKKAGVNNKFVKQMQDSFDISGSNVDEFMAKKIKKGENFQIRNLRARIDEFLEEHKRIFI